MARGYVIVHVDVRDPEAYVAYVARTPDIVARHGGRFIVRGGPVERREGEIDWKRVVVLEFPSVEAARAWYDSEDYQAVLPMRTDNATSDLIIIEGYEPPAG